MRKAITQITQLFLLFRSVLHSNNFETYKSFPHRENGSEKEKPQPKIYKPEISQCLDLCAADL
jgi:hypothetical protein